MNLDISISAPGASTLSVRASSQMHGAPTRLKAPLPLVPCTLMASAVSAAIARTSAYIAEDYALSVSEK